MGKYKSLAKNSLFVFIGNIGSKAIGFLMLPFYTRWLAVDQYGTVDLATVYVSLLFPFVTFSLCSAIFAIPVGCKKEKQAEYFMTGLEFVLISILLFSVVILVASNFGVFGDNVFTHYALYICILILTTFLQTYLQQFCMAIDKMFIFSFTGITLTAATALFGFLLIPNRGEEGFLQSLIMANVVTIIITAIIMKVHEYLVFKPIRLDLLKEMLKYSIPMIPNALLWWIIASFNRVTMNQYIGVYYLGLYAIASKLPNMLSSLISPMANSWKLSVLQEYKNEGFNKYYANVSQVIIMTACLGVVALGFLSEFIINIASETEYHVAWIYSPILLLSIVFVTLDQTVAPIFMAYRQTKYFMYASICGAISGVVLNYALIPFIGIWGAVISMVGSHAVLSIVQMYISWKYEKNGALKNISVFILLTIVANVILVLLKNYYVVFVIDMTIFSYYLVCNWKYFGQFRAIISKRRNN